MIKGVGEYGLAQREERRKREREGEGGNDCTETRRETERDRRKRRMTKIEEEPVSAENETKNYQGRRRLPGM